jgi:hypothetical protein
MVATRSMMDQDDRIGDRETLHTSDRIGSGPWDDDLVGDGQPDMSPALVSMGSLPLTRTDNRGDIGTTSSQAMTMSLAQREVEARIYRMDAKVRVHADDLEHKLYVGIMQ